jgi:hypothetical protein
MHRFHACIRSLGRGTHRKTLTPRNGNAFQVGPEGRETQNPGLGNAQIGHWAARDPGTRRELRETS